MQNIIGLRDLRENVAAYAEKVRKGNSFIVMKRSKPLFKITPIDDEGQWETVIDFTKIRKGGISAEELLEHLERLE